MRVAMNVEQCWHRVPGGTARATIDLAGALARRDDVDVVGVAARHSRPPAAAWDPGIPVRHHRLPRLALYETWHSIRRPSPEAVVGPVDLVHGMGGATPPAEAKLVVTINDLAFRHFPAMFTRHGRRFLNRALVLAEREAAAIMVPSMATLEDCAAAGVARDRLHLVPYGVHVPTVDGGDVAAARDRFALSGDYVLVVGTLEPRKNLGRLLESWSRLRADDAIPGGTKLVVVGPSGWGDALGDRAAPDDVVLTGFVERSVRDALYAGAVLSVYPSTFEGFGFPVLESMAVGCPVIASSQTSTAELLIDGGGVAIDTADTALMATTMAELLADPGRRADLGRQGEKVAASYSWAATAERVASLYAEVIS